MNLLVGPIVLLTARRRFFWSVLALLSQYSELDCEEYKLEVAVR